MPGRMYCSGMKNRPSPWPPFQRGHTSVTNRQVFRLRVRGACAPSRQTRCRFDSGFLPGRPSRSKGTNPSRRRDRGGIPEIFHVCTSLAETSESPRFPFHPILPAWIQTGRIGNLLQWSFSNKDAVELSSPKIKKFSAPSLLVQRAGPASPQQGGGGKDPGPFPGYGLQQGRCFTDSTKSSSEGCV